MARKWKPAIAIRIGVQLYFGSGLQFPTDADVLLIIFHVIWVSDRRRGNPEKSHHWAAYPRCFRRFVFDEAEDKKTQRPGDPHNKKQAARSSPNPGRLPRTGVKMG